MNAFVNIACGDTYIKSWLNLDFSPHSSDVRQADLLKRLSIDDGYADVVYSSHFIEHIPREFVFGFLEECFRITKPGGRIRLVLPDWEEMCATYLSLRRSGVQHEKADFLLTEMLDQCVRKFSGGELGAYYTELEQSPKENKEMIDFLYSRTGHVFRNDDDVSSLNRIAKVLKDPRKLLDKLRNNYVRLIVTLLPSAFRNQNVSFTSVGEKHAWMYDFYSIEKLLIQAGFKYVKRVTETSSDIVNFPFFPLDIYEDGNPRKGKESMYIEAVKI